jgi:exodeoxyribonuclease VII large subunit
VSLSDQLGLRFEAALERRIWTVQDLVSAVRTQLERQYTDVWVAGEISNFRPAESGHLYFTLKDGNAQLRVVMFRKQALLLRFRPENGLSVIARGRVTVYDARGELQLSAEYLEPKGAGALQIAFEQLKQKLAAEGLFEGSRKRPIPTLPRRIGIVSSPRGAALYDILNVLRRRHQNVHLLIYPAQVQGAEAAIEVSAGVRYFNRQPASLPGGKPVDVIIVARGGGSVEDLAAFNHEGLARTIAASRVPVISAVGHETDFTITDFVADLRAATPSAAAELVIRSRDELDDTLAQLHSRVQRAMRYRLLLASQALGDAAQRGAFARMRQLLGQRHQQLDDLRYRIAAAEQRRLQQMRRRMDYAAMRVQHHDARGRLERLRHEIEGRTGALVAIERQLVALRRAQFEQRSARLAALSPLQVLERGYAVVFDAAGNVVKSAEQLAPGDAVRARFARGEVEAEVKKRRS